MEEQSKEYIERLAKIEERIISLGNIFEEKISGLSKRFDDMVASQVKDHGKRLAAIENRMMTMESEQTIKAKEDEKRLSDLEDALSTWNKRRLMTAGGFVAGGGAIGAIIEWIASRMN